MLTFDPTLDYLIFDFLVSVDYFNVTGDTTWNGPNEINNCSFFDSLPTYDTTEAYYRRASLNIPINEWFDPTIQVQRQDYVKISEFQVTASSGTSVVRKYFVDQADFDERLQIWRLQLFTQDK